MNLRYTVILVLIAAVLGIFAWTQRQTEPVDVSKGAPTATPPPLVDLAPEDVQEVEVAGAEGSYTLTRVADGWEVDGQPASDMVNGVVTGLAKPVVLRELPPDRDPGDYGFDTLTLTVTLKTAGGASHVIEVGDDTPVDPNVYIRLRDGTRIVIIGQTDITSLKDWFINKPLAPTATPTTEGTPAAPGAAPPPVPGFPTIDPAGAAPPDGTTLPATSAAPAETITLPPVEPTTANTTPIAPPSATPTTANTTPPAATATTGGG